MQNASSQSQKALIDRSPWWDSFSSISGTLIAVIWSGSSYFARSAAGLACLVGDRYMKKEKIDIEDDWDGLEDFSSDKSVVTQQPLDNAKVTGQCKNKG